MFGFNHRHKPSFLTLLEALRSDTLGELLWIRGRYGKELTTDFFNDWRSKMSLAGGGVLLDQGIHLLDLIRLIAGPFDEYQSLVSSRSTNLPGIEDNAFALMRSSSSGVEASIHSTMTQWRYLFALEVFCSEGSAVWNGLRTPSGNYGSESLTVRTRDGAELELEGFRRAIDFGEDEWSHEANLFARYVREQDPFSVPDIREAKATLDMVEKIYKADASFWQERKTALRESG